MLISMLEDLSYLDRFLLFKGFLLKRKMMNESNHSIEPMMKILKKFTTTNRRISPYNYNYIYNFQFLILC